MALLLWLFLLFTSLYHVIVTVLIYGLWWHHPEILVVLRDGFRIVFFLLMLVVHRASLVAYIKRTWLMWLVFLVLCGVGVFVSLWQGRTTSDMVVGAKYGLQFFIIFLSAVFIGSTFNQHKEKYMELLKWLFRLSVWIVMVGLVWQIAKMVVPEFFYHIGYGPFGDRVFGQKPPLYYLTGPGGWPRLSGIFSWPNNYWYLLVALFGFWRRHIRSFIEKKRLTILLRILFSVSLLWTMSRGAIIGVFLQIIALSFVVFHKNKKYIRSIIIAGALIVGGLSFLKRWSTLAHVRTKFGSLEYVVSNPRGYGLGSSGPSIHTWHGTIMPENFFIQILIDIGVPGLIMWLLFRYLVLQSIWKNKWPTNYDQGDGMLLVCLSFSFLWLLLEWMFLHVFEDSMVNYWFFVMWGMVYWYTYITNKR